MTRKAGIGVLSSFVLGLPGETPETLRQTVEFADSLKVPYSLNLLTPYVGTEVRECSKEWGIQIHTDDWKFYGQGHPLTSTPTVTRGQLSKAVQRYRQGIGRYLEDLLEREEKGSLSRKNAEELERHRHWDFLRRLIGEEILERHGILPADMSEDDIAGLARSIARPLGMPREEARRHLAPLIRAGHIRPVRVEGGKIRWNWSPNKDLGHIFDRQYLPATPFQPIHCPSVEG